MFSARSAAMDADSPRPFTHYSEFDTRVPCVVFKAHVNCAAFLAAGG
jgi:hypothetical protein